MNRLIATKWLEIGAAIGVLAVVVYSACVGAYGAGVVVANVYAIELWQVVLGAVGLAGVGCLLIWLIARRCRRAE